MAEPVRYRFGDPSRVGVILGMSLRQTVPIVAGVLWLTLMLVVGLPLLGAIGPLVGLILSLGRWKRAPLHDVARPGLALTARRIVGTATWRRQSLRTRPVTDGDVPLVLRGLEIVDTEVVWHARPTVVGVIRDRAAGTLSMVIPITGGGFPVASPVEQDGIVAAWGAALAPVARARCPISRVTWQEWCHPVGVDGHRRFLTATGRSRTHNAANDDYARLLTELGPYTVAHDVHLTLTADLRRVRGRRGRPAVEAGIEALVDEARQLAARLETGGFSVDTPLSAAALVAVVRWRSDPAHQTTTRRSLAEAVGHSTGEWGPMAVEPNWFETRVDGSWHRSFAVAGWPMLPVPADWMSPLLTGDDATRTVTVVLEPVPLAAAAQDANRQLTSIEADHEQKERHGFRLTAR
ncbi:MAG: SCO6880 family protein, partial [Acidimicrobiia bacterium]